MSLLKRKITEKNYYDYFPPNAHAPGDIWKNLPTHGLLSKDRCSGIVVTPSCDLFNRKVSTISYLPIVSFYEWVGSQDFVSEVSGSMSSIGEQLSQLEKFDDLTPAEDNGFSSHMEKRIEFLREKLSTSALSRTLRTACERYIAGGNHLRRTALGKTVDIKDLELCLSKNRWENIRRYVVRNSFRSDLYFLPADDNDEDLSPVPNHSVVLFRYPLTVPIAVLDLAQDLLISDWPTGSIQLAEREPIARSVIDARPVKCLRLRGRFLPDLLTKFVSLYSRLGSPDFSEETVELISRELGESR
jgi:hypothetical protein